MKEMKEMKEMKIIKYEKNLSTLPLDLIKKILLYDNRFVLRKGNLIMINKLDKEKYANAFYFLKYKPRIIQNNYNIYFNSYVYIGEYKIQYSNENIYTTDEYNHITYQFQKCIPVIQLYSFFKILDRYTIG
jgi:hypothetical protein